MAARTLLPALATMALFAAPAAEAAAGACALRPGLEVALHLCLSEGLPAADPVEVPDLLDADGRLALSFGRLLLIGCLPPWWSLRRRLACQLIIDPVQLLLLIACRLSRRIEGVFDCCLLGRADAPWPRPLLWP